METKALRVIIAGGGTGGHFFPGLAVAQAVKASASPCEVLFVGGRNGIEAAKAPAAGFAFRALPVSGFTGVSFLRRLKSALAVPLALVISVGVLVQFRPSVVVGVGGYASFPMALAGGLVGIPVILLEQNLQPGLANRLLSRLASAVVVAFPQTLRFFGGRGWLLGNPVRQSLTRVPPEQSPERPFRLLVFGGSRGARAINDAFADCARALAGFEGGIEITHQTGVEDADRLRRAYADAGIRARVEPFIDAMDEAYAWCHAVLCRSGATSLAELAVVRRPALLVPFPQAVADHQLLNARGLSDLGGALLLEQKDLTAASLQGALRELSDKAVRARMAARLSEVAKPRAATEIARLVALAGGVR